MKKWIRIFIFLLMIWILTIGVTGCWSNKDLSKRALVAAVGLDKADNGQIELTLEIIKPSAVGGTEGNPTTEEPIWIHSSKANTVFEAVRDQVTEVNRKPYYSHIQTIVIGEKLAKSGIQDVLDFFFRDHEPRLTPTVLIAKGTTAKKILETKNELEKMSAFNLKEITENEENNPVIQKVILFDLLKQLSASGREVTIGVVETVNDTQPLEKRNVRVEGSGVFRSDQLIGWLSPTETAGLQYILGNVESGIITVPNPLQPSKLLSIEQVKAREDIKAEASNSELVFHITITGKGNIGGQQGRGDLTTEVMIEKIEKETEQTIKQQIHQAVEAAQKKHGSDILGLGGVVHREYPKLWNQIKDDWDDQFKKASIDINVEFKIKQLGLIGKTLNIE
ncbi:Ger(x)C family spore germination protein [Anaerosolibacter sp.]|uniref:Ger(x)C family spore germination protein n=1 Tax=Anaerosolibacter sp. TaxID=1872527 RepID=UPI0039F0B56F